MTAFLVIKANECCGCSAPVFVGVYPTEESAVASANRIREDTEVIPFDGDTPLEGWCGL